MKDESDGDLLIHPSSFILHPFEMAEPVCDYFPMLTADGPTQMAADEALLEHVLTTGRPALRYYTWDPPTLSLGYFQSFADRLPGLPVVRRMTGGGAIVH